MIRARALIIIVLLLLSCATATPALAGSWSGTTYNGTNAGETATGDGSAETFYMLNGNDTAIGNGGADHILGGNGTDVSKGGGGYDEISACGSSGGCGSSVGNDWMYSGDGGALIRAGQSPAVRQNIVCSQNENFDEVFYDSADRFYVLINGNLSGPYNIGGSGCDYPHKVG